MSTASSSRPRCPLRLLAPAVLLVLAGCGSGGGDSGSEPGSPPTSPSNSPAGEPSTPSGQESATPSEPETTKQPTMSRSQATALLTRAVAEGDLASVKRAVANKARLETRNGEGQTPLVVATKARRAKIARVLLEAGADPNAKDDIEDSAFLYAGAEGFNDILRLTLKHGADVKSLNRYAGTALIPASEHAHVETVRILLEAGVPVNHVNDLDWTAMLEAIVLGNGSARHVQVVEMLLAAGADPSIRDGDGRLPRELAAERGFQGIVDAIDRAAEN